MAQPHLGWTSTGPARASLRWALALMAAMAMASGCDDEPAPSKSAVTNPEVYQGFFAHYPFGGHPVDAWKERLDALAPGGHQEDAKAYTLARRRADQVGLRVSGEGQHHEVKIKPAVIELLIKRVDAMRDVEGS